MNEQDHLKTLKATTWEELNPDWIEDGDLTDRFAKSQFDTCPSCDSIENIRVVNSSGDDEMASVLCCNWQCNGDCPSEAIENWNRRAAISAIERSRWVAVEDRLPEKTGRYLITRLRRADGKYLTREAFFDYEFTRTFAPFETIKDVVAWAEKPQPYTPKEQI